MSIGEGHWDLGVNNAPLNAGVNEADSRLQKLGATAVGTGNRLADATNRANSGFQGLIGKVGGMHTILQGVGLSIGTTIANIGQQAVSAVVGTFGDAISAASDMAEAQSKVNVVFGTSAATINAWAETAAESMGLSSRAAEGAAGTFGNLFTAMGITQPKAADMSTSIVQLASDLASFNNTSSDDALIALRAGLVGEIEPLRRYGVNLYQATIEAKAMELGLWDGKGAIDASAKAQAAYAIILDQTTNAQGDYARTADGLANSQRTLGAEWDNALVQIGNLLIPAMLLLVQALTKGVIPAVSFVAETLGKINPVVWAGIATAIFALFLPSIIAATTAIGAMTLAAAPWILAIAAIVAGALAASAAINDLALNFGDMGDRLHSIADSTGQDFQAVKDVVKDGMDSMGLDFETASERAQRAFELMREGMTLDAALAQVDADMGTLKGTVAAGVGETASTLAAGAPKIAGAAGDMAAPIPAAVGTAADQSVAAASKLPGDIAKAIREGRSSWKDAMHLLQDDMKEEGDAASHIAELKGALTNKKLIAGMHSNDPLVRAQANATYLLIQEELTKERSYAWGEHMAAAFAQGLADQESLVAAKAARLAAAAAGPLESRSPPRMGPLREIDKWGYNLASTFAGGFDRFRLGDFIGRVLQPTGDLVLRAAVGRSVSSIGGPAPLAALAGAAGIGGPRISIDFHWHGLIEPSMSEGDRIAAAISDALVRRLRHQRILPANG